MSNSNIIYGTIIGYGPIPGGFAQFLSYPVKPNTTYDVQALAGDGSTWNSSPQKLTTAPGQNTWSSTLQFPNGAPIRLVQE